VTAYFNEEFSCSSCFRGYPLSILLPR